MAISALWPNLPPHRREARVSLVLSKCESKNRKVIQTAVFRSKLLAFSPLSFDSEFCECQQQEWMYLACHLPAGKVGLFVIWNAAPLTFSTGFFELRTAHHPTNKQQQEATTNKGESLIEARTLLGALLA